MQRKLKTEYPEKYQQPRHYLVSLTDSIISASAIPWNCRLYLYAVNIVSSYIYRIKDFCLWLRFSTTWWRHPMEAFSASLAFCAGNSPVTGEFLAQRPVTQSFDVFFDLRLNKRLSKQLWDWWFETQSCPLWRHRNGNVVHQLRV